MKKLITIVLLVAASLNLFSQENYKWEKIDSVNKTKNQIYSDTKIFIAKTWISANDVIQNDDKENGNIILNGSKEIEVSGMDLLGSSLSYSYYYNYTVIFKFKDGKYKLEVGDVNCYKSYSSGSNIPVQIQPNDIFPGAFKSGILKNGWIYVKDNLKSDLQNIVDSYSTFIKTSTKDDF